MIHNKFIECNILERFNEVTSKIIAFEDERTGGEYSRTNTTQIYPEPDEEELPFYFPIESKWFGLFDESEMVDEIPIIESEDEDDDEE